MTDCWLDCVLWIHRRRGPRHLIEQRSLCVIYNNANEVYVWLCVCVRACVSRWHSEYFKDGWTNLHWKAKRVQSRMEIIPTLFVIILVLQGIELLLSPALEPHHPIQCFDQSTHFTDENVQMEINDEHVKVHSNKQLLFYLNATHKLSRPPPHTHKKPR